MNPGDLLAQLLIQEDSNGCWLWKGPMYSVGYAKLQLEGTPHYMHRIFWESAHGPIPEGMVIDHMCGVKRCVNPEHLQAVTHAENCEHRPKLNKNNTSGVRGVTWDKRGRKWRAQVSFRGKNHYVGDFLELEAAAEAVASKRAEFFTNNLDDREPPN